jgi:hypothetical protein
LLRAVSGVRLAHVQLDGFKPLLPYFLLCLALNVATLARAQDAGGSEAPAQALPTDASPASDEAMPPDSVPHDAAEPGAATPKSTSKEAAGAAPEGSQHRAVVIGRTPDKATTTHKAEGPDGWSPHDKRSPRAPATPESWFLELGGTYSPGGDHGSSSVPFGTQAALGFAVRRHLQLVLRHDMLQATKHPHDRWRTHALSMGVRPVLSLVKGLALFAELDFGLALANRKRSVMVEEPPMVPFGYEPQTVQESSEELAPYVRIAAGIAIGKDKIGLLLGATYIHAKPVSAFYAAQNDGGAGILFAFRVRGF